MAEIWYDPADDTLKAVYSTKYNGRLWQDKGYVAVTIPGTSIPPGLKDIGTKLDVTGPVPVVIAPAPVPEPEPFVPDANYAAATTTDEKLDVIARRIGLIE